MSVKLRVLAGANAGAELLLTEGDWLVGTDAEADITLAEPALAGRHLRLSVGTGSVTLHALAAGSALWDRAVAAGETVALAEGVPVSIGATRFALGEGPLQSPPPPPTPKRTEAAPLVAPSPGQQPPGQLAGQRRRLPVLVIGGLLLALVLPVSGVAWLLGNAPASPAGPPSPSVMLDEANQVIRRLGLADRIAVRLEGERLVVAGQIETTARLEVLVGALRSAGLAAELKVVTDAEMTDLVRTVIRAFGINATVAVTGPGRVRLEGFATDDRQVEAALRRLHTDIPGLLAVEDRLATPGRARAAPRGVSLGRSPFVLLENGQRLTIGGSYDTGTVVGITADGLRLRIASGEITVPFAQTPRWVMEESDESKR